MAEIVGERQRLRQVLIQPQPSRERAGDLRDFERMGQPGAVVVALMEDKNLSFVLEAPESGGMDNAVAIAAKRAAGCARGLGMEPTAGCFRVARIGRTGYCHIHRRHGLVW